MLTILQDTINKIQIFNTVEFTHLLIVFTYRHKQVVGIFANQSVDCPYYLIDIIEVGENGTVNNELGEIKLSPQSTWKGTVYGQNSDSNIDPSNATLIQAYDFQVKGVNPNTYPVISPDIDCLPATVIVEDQNGNELANQQIASGETDIIILNTPTEPLYTYPYDLFNTGQDVVFAQGDDKDIRDTVYIPEIAAQEASGLLLVYPRLSQTDPTKLVWGSNPNGSGTNIFGNLERFTDDLGLQNYANGVKYDHYLGLMAKVDVFTSFINWISALTAANNLTFFNKSDWHLGNTREHTLSKSWGIQAEFLGVTISTGVRFMSSTTDPADSSVFQWLRLSEEIILNRDKGQSANAVFFRKAFTYNSTTKQMQLS